MRASVDIYRERAQQNMLATSTRAALALAALLLLSVYVLPLWRIDLDAPQYPEGLGMYIEVDAIRGAAPGNLESINGLNHYIGMKPIHPESIPELRIMPWIFGGLIVLGLAAAAYGRRWALYAWVGLFVLLAAAGLVDFYLWGYDYGHNLDHERAIIKVPGMTYQPPLIGMKRMLNITALSIPASGGVLTLVSLVIGLSAAWCEWSRRGRLRMSARPVAVGMVAAALVSGCAVEPRPIAYGEEACHHCMMTIADVRFGAEVVSEKGKVLVFDSIECLGAYLDESEDEHASIWVTDMINPGTLIPAASAFYAESEAIRSPMGGRIAAFASEADRDRTLDEGGRALTWSEVRELSRMPGHTEIEGVRVILP